MRDELNIIMNSKRDNEFITILQVAFIAIKMESQDYFMATAIGEKQLVINGVKNDDLIKIFNLSGQEEWSYFGHGTYNIQLPASGIYLIKKIDKLGAQTTVKCFVN